MTTHFIVYGKSIILRVTVHSNNTELERWRVAKSSNSEDQVHLSGRWETNPTSPGVAKINILDAIKMIQAVGEDPNSVAIQAVLKHENRVWGQGELPSSNQESPSPPNPENCS